MFEIVIRKQDTLPLISRKVYLDGKPVDLTGYALEFVVMTTSGTVVFNNSANLVSGGDSNEVQYQWTDADSALVESGTYFAVFTGEKASDKLTFPNNRPLSLMITDTGAWEYSYSGDPSTRPIDRVRFLLNDKDMNRAIFTDKEIEFLLAENGSNAYFAAADLAATQAGSYSSLSDKTVGPLSIKYGEQAGRWATLAKSLRSRGSSQSGARAIFTGTVREPMFKIGMNDNPVSDLPAELGGLTP